MKYVNVLLCFMILSTCCSGIAAALEGVGPPIMFQGKVYDAVTKKPLPGVIVIVGDASGGFQAALEKVELMKTGVHRYDMNGRRVDPGLICSGVALSDSTGEYCIIYGTST